jgi:hypothetical protein
MVVGPRNRLAPRYINMATTRYNELLGPQHNQAQKKKERKRKENNADTSGSTKTKMTRNHCALRRIPTTLLALQIAAYQTTPPRRKATTTTLLMHTYTFQAFPR